MTINQFVTRARNYTFFHAVYAGVFNGMSDEDYLKMMFRRSLGYELDLSAPKTFNEKMQWLKLYHRRPEFTDMVDKLEAKRIAARTMGTEHVIPTLAVWDRVEDIDLSVLPEQFVLKTTHDCGGVVICRNKAELDLEAVKQTLGKHMKLNYYITNREWPYKNVKPRIIAEELMVDGDNEVLPVYKVFCFGGKPHLIQAIVNDKQRDEAIDYFDTDWNKLDLRQNFPNSDRPLPRPEKLDEMLALAAEASEGFSFLRVDFYVVNGKVYFSEFTFYSDAGTAAFTPSEWDRRLGDLIALPA